MNDYFRKCRAFYQVSEDVTEDRCYKTSHPSNMNLLHAKFILQLSHIIILITLAVRLNSIACYPSTCDEHSGGSRSGTSNLT